MKRIRTDRELRHQEQHLNRPRQEIAWCLLIYKRTFSETGIQRVKCTVKNEAGPVHGVLQDRLGCGLYLKLWSLT